MKYYIETAVKGSVEEVESLTRQALSAEGFGIVSQLDIAATLREKVGAEIGTYRVLGACNPAFARDAIALEPMVGTMLPCNVVIRSGVDGACTVAAIDPVAGMIAIDNPQLAEIAKEVRERLTRSIRSLAPDAASGS